MYIFTNSQFSNKHTVQYSTAQLPKEEVAYTNVVALVVEKEQICGPKLVTSKYRTCRNKV